MATFSPPPPSPRAPVLYWHVGAIFQTQVGLFYFQSKVIEVLIKLSVVQQKYEFFVSPSQASWKVSHGWSYYELLHIETLIFTIRFSRLQIGLRGGTSFFDGLFYRSLILVKDKREIKINAHIQDAEVTRCFTRVSFSKPCALLLLFGNTFSPTRSLCTQLRHKNPEYEIIEVVCRHLKMSYAS